ncbi:acetyltransferase, GNAT family, potentially associated with YqeK [Lachnospiraceae bacterium KM106-2]|nr:acetyltransferase, GNAT family, potentially associated with YqeK [Lachnospiraceae bacterium KM106-2]
MVEINGITYEFCDNIGQNTKRLKSFNELAKSTFGISFSSVGGDYEPHVLMQDDKVCANISVNKMPLVLDGKKIFAIQLGTVMTRKEYRGKGLSRYIMEHIIEKWKDHCDMVYLFANDSVLDFYPKFGFVEQKEYDYQVVIEETKDIPVRKLDMTKEADITLLWEKYKQGNPYSRFVMVENCDIMEFYCFGFLKDNVYYCEKADTVMVAEEDGDVLLLYDIFGSERITLTSIMKAMAAASDKKKIRLGFTPKESDGLVENVHKEEDTTLFVLKGGEGILKGQKIMFPMISHA